MRLGTAFEPGAGETKFCKPTHVSSGGQPFSNYKSPLCQASVSLLCLEGRNMLGWISPVGKEGLTTHSSEERDSYIPGHHLSA